MRYCRHSGMPGALRGAVDAHARIMRWRPLGDEALGFSIVHMFQAHAAAAGCAAQLVDGVLCRAAKVNQVGGRLKSAGVGLSWSKPAVHGTLRKLSSGARVVLARSIVF